MSTGSNSNRPRLKAVIKDITTTNTTKTTRPLRSSRNGLENHQNSTSISSYFSTGPPLEIQPSSL
jgi:hypothetical protein